MHLVGFIIRTHHDARSSECQIRERNSRHVNFLTYEPKKLKYIASIRIFFVYSENLQEGYNLEVSVVDGKVILKCILSNCVQWTEIQSPASAWQRPGVRSSEHSKELRITQMAGIYLGGE